MVFPLSGGTSRGLEWEDWELGAENVFPREDGFSPERFLEGQSFLWLSKNRSKGEGLRRFSLGKTVSAQNGFRKVGRAPAFGKPLQVS